MKEQDTQAKNNKGLKMYFVPEVAEKFAELEQNEKNFKVAQIVDTILLQESAELQAPVYCAELGGGAHPDRYEAFFNKLLSEEGHMDWVDVSPIMLELAKKYITNEKYQNRKKVITFVTSDILEYLCGLENDKLDLTIMKYTIDYIEDLHELFKLLSQKMTQGGKLVATIGSTTAELKSHSTNARFLYNDKQFPDNETRVLHDGDTIRVKFFKVSGDPISGFLEGAETLKYYHSPKKLKELADVYGLDIFLGDWKELVPKENQKNETIDQEVLVLTKK